MSTTKQIAKHVREIYFGGNWTGVNLKDTLADVTWQQATTQVYSFNTIHTLVFHIQYYVDAILKVFKGEPLNAKDEYSFIHPPLQNEQDWKKLLTKMFNDAEEYASLIEQLPDNILWKNLDHEKYGSYYRNLHGTIEHTNYHLGQIMLIKKIIADNAKQ